MRGMKRRVGYGAVVGVTGGVLLASLSVLVMPVSAQRGQGAQPREAPDWSRIAGNFGDVKVLPNGGPTPRTADGHPDLSGRYYPNRAGRMLQGGYRLGEDVMRQFDAAVTPQGEVAFRPETKEKYQYPTPYGICAPGGTPTSITTQATEHGPIELVQRPGVVWILTEFPQTIRWIPTDGRPHSENPDVSFNGESVGHWEGETLVVDTIAIDERMRNISVGRRGDGGAWTHSPEERVIERFTRVSEKLPHLPAHRDRSRGAVGAVRFGASYLDAGASCRRRLDGIPLHGERGALPLREHGPRVEEAVRDAAAALTQRRARRLSQQAIKAPRMRVNVWVSAPSSGSL